MGEKERKREGEAEESYRQTWKGGKKVLNSLFVIEGVVYEKVQKVRKFKSGEGGVRRGKQSERWRSC